MPPKRTTKKITKAIVKRSSKKTPVKKQKNAIPATNIADEIDYGINSDEEITEEIIEESEDITLETKQTIVKEKYEYKPVIRRELIILDANNRMTSEIMSKFEYTNVIATRAKQLEKNPMVFTDINNITDYKEMAEKEVRDKKCPLDIIRHISDNVIERWHVNEMGVPVD